jgi:ABC-2 type transport system permease protein
MTATAFERSHLTFGGTVRSEWIKLVTLRSTMWCYAIMILVPIGLGFLLAATVSNVTGGGEMSAENQQAIWLQVATLGIGFTQLVSVVLGALVITGEYGTGMIRSTFAAVPARIPALVAKGLVFGLVTFVVSLVSITATAVLVTPVIAGNGVTPDLGDGSAWLAMVGGAGYLALIGLMAMAIGAIIRNSAGGIAAGLGLVLVAPTVLQIIAGVTQAVWAQNVAAFLPSTAGGAMYAYPADAATSVDPGGAAATTSEFIVLEAWQGALVLGGWLAVLAIVAGVLLKRRDV